MLLEVSEVGVVADRADDVLEMKMIGKAALEEHTRPERVALGEHAHADFSEAARRRVAESRDLIVVARPSRIEQERAVHAQRLAIRLAQLVGQVDGMKTHDTAEQPIAPAHYLLVHAVDRRVDVAIDSYNS